MLHPQRQQERQLAQLQQLHRSCQPVKDARQVRLHRDMEAEGLLCEAGLHCLSAEHARTSQCSFQGR